MMDLTTIARPYAQAAFEYANAEKTLDQWQFALAELAEHVAHVEVENFLKNPTYSAEQRADMCFALISTPLSGSQQNFIKLLAEGHRLSTLPAVFELFVALRSEAEKILPVMVKSAFPLEADDLKKINTLLNAQFKQDIALETEVDPSLIGGILIRAGDHVIDGSVRGQLEQLKKVVIE